ncbi:tape measure protein [Shewanella algae]|uniref:tape measure protein n=1 Tax=Shewanella algae TaxID=38313 RepID=UPI000F42206F|nr:tape measure protein [Shewanella algae]AYV12992.1 phage tail tape measure protein [Shewanella algae]
MSNKTLELALRIVAEATGKQSIEALVEELKRIGDASDSVNPKAAELARELDDLGSQQDLINSFKASRNALEEQELALTAAALSLDDLRRQAERTDEPFVQLARTIDSAEKELEQMQRELAEQSASHTKLQQALSKSGIDYNNLSVSQRKLGADFDTTGRKVDNFSRELSQGNAQARNHADSLRGVVAQVAALATAYVGFDRVAQVVKEVFTTGDKFERLGVQFNALMGSISGGEKATAWVKDFAKNTPLQLDEVSQVFVKLKAFGIDPMSGAMQAVTDQALKLGGGFQEVEGISLALGQAWAKQKLQGEEILQLVERGVPVWDMLATVTGKNTAELQKMSEQGKLGRDVIKSLIDEMGRSSTGSAAAQMALLSGQVSNLKDNVSQFYDLVAQSGALDWLKNEISGLNAEFAAMAADGRLREWAQTFSDSIISAGAAIKSAMSLLYDYREEIGFVAKAWLALKVGSYFSDVVVGARAAMAAMRSYAAIVATTSAATDAATIAAGKWKKALAAVGRAGMYLWLIEELIAVGVAYKALLDAREAQAKAEREAASSSQQLAAELKALSEQTGVAFENMEEFNKAVEGGALVYDNASGKWRSAASAMKEVADASDAIRKELAKLEQPILVTVDEALRLTDVLNRQAGSLENVKGGIGGFINTVDLAIDSLKSQGDEYAAHITLLEQLKVKFQDHQTYLDAMAKGSKALEQAYKDLGVTSANALQKTADKSRAAFELIRDAREPLAQQKEAFQAWAKAALEAAEAIGKPVPQILKTEAANLGLSKSLDELITKQLGFADATAATSPEQIKLSRELQTTEQRLQRCKEVLDSSTASSLEKAKASAELTRLQTQLGQQTRELTEIQALEAANYSQLKAKYEAVSDELLRLEKAYQDNGLTATEYLQQKERLGNVLTVLQRLMGGYADAEKAASEQTQKATKTLAEQREELERLQEQTGRATEYVSYFAEAQAALDQTFNFSSTSTEELKERYKELGDNIAQNMQVGAGWWQLLSQMSIAGFENERSVISQTLRYRQLMAAVNTGAMTLGQLNKAAKDADIAFRDLDDQTMEKLRGAIADARQQIIDLRDDINATVGSLQDELDKLNNNQAAIEKRRYQQQRQELQAKLKEAEAAEDQASVSAARQALQLAEQVYNLKQKQVEQDLAERQQQSPAERPTTNTSNNSPIQNQPPPSTTSAVGGSAAQTVRLELVLPSGNQIDAAVYGSAAEQLLDELERIKGTS